MQGLARSLRIEQIPSLAASIDQAACLMKALDVKIAPGPPWQGNHQSFKISGAGSACCLGSGRTRLTQHAQHGENSLKRMYLSFRIRLDNAQLVADIVQKPLTAGAVVFQGQGKRVPVSGFRQQRRAGRGKRGIALNCGDTLAAVHMVSSCAAYACIACGKQVGLEERYCWQEE